MADIDTHVQVPNNNDTLKFKTLPFKSWHGDTFYGSLAMLAMKMNLLS